VSVIEAMTLLPGDVTTPAAARRFVRAALESVEADPVVIETAELLTDELVTNAIVHAGCKSHLFIRAARGVVRVEITDPDDRLPTMAAPDPDALGGRGLIIVNGLASAWGVEATTKGGHRRRSGADEEGKGRAPRPPPGRLIAWGATVDDRQRAEIPRNPGS
jgi:anti-sigma regulatory factor (Ser/Thr protein kinase)